MWSIARYVSMLRKITAQLGFLKVNMQRVMNKSPLINGWPLFWCLTLFAAAFMVRASVLSDLNSPEGISGMIQYSVRWAVPLIFLITATSAMARLFPNTMTRWLMRNRRYVGLSFAAAMAWQGAFIFWISVGHPDHYYTNIYFLRDELEGSSGYLFLTAMIVTSFPFGRRHLSPAHWSVLHRAGVYFLWAYPFSVYWWNTAYYGSELWLDYLFYGLGFRLRPANRGMGQGPVGRAARHRGLWRRRQTAHCSRALARCHGFSMARASFSSPAGTRPIPNIRAMAALLAFSAIPAFAVFRPRHMATHPKR